jgi:hypothetical protein
MASEFDSRLTTTGFLPSCVRAIVLERVGVAKVRRESEATSRAELPPAAASCDEERECAGADR